MHYDNKTPPAVHGKQIGKRDEVILQPDELITTVEGGIQSNVLGRLTFVTNKGLVAVFPVKSHHVPNISFLREKFWPFRQNRTGFGHGKVCVECRG